MFRMMRLITLAPGHFHAALVQKRAPYGVATRGYVYGPLDADSLAHLGRVAEFNARRDTPTAWEIDARLGDDYLDRFRREQPGNVVVLSGRNRPKIDLMRLAVENCLNVLADKPWIVEHADFPRLEAVLREAELRDVLVSDVLTERFEITNWLQRELVRDATLFGAWQPGAVDRPGLDLHSTHSLSKVVSGRPVVRPWWWFDPATSGEAMADVGTHLADLAVWFVSPDRAVDYATQIHMLSAARTPLPLSEDEFRHVTQLPGFPPPLRPRAAGGRFAYTGGGGASLLLCGVHVRLRADWVFESAGDTHRAVARGTRATVSVRQEPGGRPELFVAPTDPGAAAEGLARLRARCDAFQHDLAGLSVADLGAEWQVVIPESWRATHEDHFGAVMEEFGRYFQTPRAVPAWEHANALARYYITTKAVEMSR